MHAKKSDNPAPDALSEIAMAELVAELERRAADEGREEVLRLLAPLIDPFYIPGTLDRRGESTGAIASRGDTNPKVRHDAPVVDPYGAEHERSAPRPNPHTGSPGQIRRTDEDGDRA